jgi:hypothetical protein
MVTRLQTIGVAEEFTNNRGDLFAPPCPVYAFGEFELAVSPCGLVGIPSASLRMTQWRIHFWASNCLARLSSGRVEFPPAQVFNNIA